MLQQNAVLLVSTLNGKNRFPIMFATSHLNYIDTLPIQRKYHVPTPPTLQHPRPQEPHQEERMMAENPGNEQQVTPQQP